MAVAIARPVVMSGMNAGAIMPTRTINAAVVAAGPISTAMPAGVARTRKRARRKGYGRDQRPDRAEFANKQLCLSLLLSRIVA